jgi:hypothetical protein
LKTWNLTSKRLSGTSSGTTHRAYVLQVDARVLDAGSLSFCNWCVDNVKGSWRYCGLITSARMCERHGVALETPLAAERAVSQDELWAVKTRPKHVLLSFSYRRCYGSDRTLRNVVHLALDTSNSIAAS